MIKCYFDGACEPVNPGGNLGCGAIIYKDNISLFEFSGFVEAKKENSNNVAEYLALERILIWLSENNYQENKIFVYGDSMMVIKQMTGKWRIKRGFYVDVARRCKKILSEFKKEIVFNWIPRELNSIADELSKSSMIKNGIRFEIQPNA